MIVTIRKTTRLLAKLSRQGTEWKRPILSASLGLQGWLSGVQLNSTGSDGQQTIRTALRAGEQKAEHWTWTVNVILLPNPWPVHNSTRYLQVGRSALIDWHPGMRNLFIGSGRWEFHNPWPRCLQFHNNLNVVTKNSANWLYLRKPVNTNLHYLLYGFLRPLGPSC